MPAAEPGCGAGGPGASRTRAVSYRRHRTELRSPQVATGRHFQYPGAGEQQAVGHGVGTRLSSCLGAVTEGSLPRSSNNAWPLDMNPARSEGAGRGTTGCPAVRTGPPWQPPGCYFERPVSGPACPGGPGPQVPVTRMLTKARAVRSGRPDTTGGRARRRRETEPRNASLQPRPGATRTIPGPTCAQAAVRAPANGVRRYLQAERVDGHGFQPQFLSDSQAITPTTWRLDGSRREHCMMGKHERACGSLRQLGGRVAAADPLLWVRVCSYYALC